MCGLYADLVLINGNILTLDDDSPSAEAVAVKDGKIVFVGSGEDVQIFIGPHTSVVNLNGKTMLPGFCDTHIHFVSLGLSLMQINLRDISSIAELKARVKEWVESVADGKWILGRGWDQERFTDGRYPTRWDLDEVSPDNPVLLRRVCGHISVANSKALEAAGITHLTPDPDGGKIERDDRGEPTGILKESANRLVWAAIPSPSFDDYVKAVKLASEEALKHGLTSIHLVSATPQEFKVLQYLHRNGELPIRICLYISSSFLDSITDLGLMRGFGDDFLKINGVKTLIDGSLGGRTAALKASYSDSPESSGMLTMSHDELKQIISKVHESGLQLAVHVIGDRAAEMAINVYEEVLGDHPEVDHRHRLEHASVLSPDLIERMGRLGLAASVQPRFIISDFWAVDRLGEKRARWTYPFKSMIEHGVHIAGGSDCPVDPLDPMYQIYSAVTRGKYLNIALYKYTQDECLSPLEAIKLFTKYAAYLGFEEDVKGTISVGKLADFVVLSDDPVKVDDSKIKEIKVLMTIVDGKIAYTSFFKIGG